MNINLYKNTQFTDFTFNFKLYYIPSVPLLGYIERNRRELVQVRFEGQMKFKSEEAGR